MCNQYRATSHGDARRTLEALLSCLLLVGPYAAALPHAEAHSGVSLTGFTAPPPVLDGNIGAGEWAAAGTVNFGPFMADGQTITGTLYMMNDAANLYIAVAISGDDDYGLGDVCHLRFDNDHGGESSFEQGDDSLLFGSDIGLIDMFYSAGLPPPGFYVDGLYGGSSNGQGAGGQVAANLNHFELSHPLDSADDAHDFSLSVGQTVGFTLFLDIDGGEYSLQSYGLGGGSNPSTFANYLVASPAVTPVVWGANWYTLFNGRTVLPVVGDSAAHGDFNIGAVTIDIIGLIDIALGVANGATGEGIPSSRLDTEVLDHGAGHVITYRAGYTTQDMISAGGPVVNILFEHYNRAPNLAPMYWDMTTPVPWPIINGQTAMPYANNGMAGFITALDDGGRRIFLVSGWTGAVTRGLSRILRAAQENPTGAEAQLLGGSQGGLGLTCTDSDGDGHLCETNEWTNPQRAFPSSHFAMTYGGPGDETAFSVQQTSDGGYIVAGETTSFGAGWLPDFWILKLDENGNVRWQRRYGGTGEDAAASVHQTFDGGYVVAGLTGSFGAGDLDMWVLKLDPEGSIEWQKTYGGGFQDFAISVQQTSDGGYIAGGRTFSFGAGLADLWVLKLDTVGNIEWEKRYGGADFERRVETIRQTWDGGYILAGTTLSFGAAGDIFGC